MRKLMILLPIIFGFLVANFTATSDDSYWRFIIQAIAIVAVSTAIGFLRFWRSNDPSSYMYALTGIPMYIFIGIISYLFFLIF